MLPREYKAVYCLDMALYQSNVEFCTEKDGIRKLISVALVTSHRLGDSPTSVQSFVKRQTCQNILFEYSLPTLRLILLHYLGDAGDLEFPIQGHVQLTYTIYGSVRKIRAKSSPRHCGQALLL